MEASFVPVADMNLREISQVTPAGCLNRIVGGLPPWDFEDWVLAGIGVLLIYALLSSCAQERPVPRLDGCYETSRGTICPPKR